MLGQQEKDQGKIQAPCKSRQVSSCCPSPFTMCGSFSVWATRLPSFSNAAPVRSPTRP